MATGQLAIKLVRWGFVRRPFFVLAVAPKRTARNSGRRFEDVGWWDPNPAGDGNMHMGLKTDRIKYWLSVGAQPTPKALQLIAQAGILPAPPKPLVEKQRDPKDLTKWWKKE